MGGPDEPTFLERLSRPEDETRDSRRREARRRWREGGPEEPSELERRMGLPEGLSARGAQAANIDRSVHVNVDAGAVVVHGATGEEATRISEAVAQEIVDRVRRELRRDEERMLDLTFSDPDPTLMP